MVTIEQMVGTYLRAGNPDTPQQQAIWSAACLRAMKKCSSYSHNDHLFFQDLLVEVRFRTDYSVEQCKSFQAKILSFWVQLDARSSTPNANTPLKIVTKRTSTTRLKKSQVWRYDPTYNAPDHTWISGYSYTRNGKEVSVRGHWRRRPSKTSITKNAA